jgi:hypothetical protein
MAFTGKLLPYQNQAVDMMFDRKKVLVAYDLGLGKTVLTIAAVEALRDAGHLLGPTIVVCLSSLKYQWQKEIKKFSTSSAIVIDGSKTARERQYEEAETYDYIILNYEQVVNDWDYVVNLPFGALVMDEATAVKSFRSKRSKKVKELSRRVDIRFGLTGTPVENGKPEELYSIMQSIDSSVLGQRFDLFDATFIVRNKFGGVERYRNLPKLHERLKTASVRKAQTDPDVAPYLPDTIERDPFLVPFDRHGAVIYRQIATALELELSEAQNLFGSSWSIYAHYGQGRQVGGPEDAMRGAIMSKITALRMLCDHPKLLASSAALYDPFVADKGSKFLNDFLEDPKVSSILDKCKTPKLDILREMVKDHLSDDGNKVVVFCSYVEMASLIHEAVGGVVYTGKMDAKAKEAAKVQFQTDPETRCLISTDAGGYGVDLPQANLLINYDLPWSSGLAVQRNGRIKRASSKWPSIVIQDLLMADSVEERQYDLLRQKTAVAAAVVDGKGINDKGGVDMTAGSLIDFLRVRQP